MRSRDSGRRDSPAFTVVTRVARYEGESCVNNNGCTYSYTYRRCYCICKTLQDFSIQFNTYLRCCGITPVIRHVCVCVCGGGERICTII